MSMQERAARLRERVGSDYPDAWDFNEIPSIVGIVESLSRVETTFGARVVATVTEVEGPEDARKSYAVWLSQQALYNRFRTLDIREGELVAISYLGVGEAARPGLNPPHRFRVEVDRGGGDHSFDWSRATGPHEDAPPPINPDRREMTREEHERALEAAAGRDYDRPPIDDDIPF